MCSVLVCESAKCCVWICAARYILYIARSTLHLCCSNALGATYVHRMHARTYVINRIFFLLVSSALWNCRQHWMRFSCGGYRAYRYGTVDCRRWRLTIDVIHAFRTFFARFPYMYPPVLLAFTHFRMYVSVCVCLRIVKWKLSSRRRDAFCLTSYAQPAYTLGTHLSMSKNLFVRQSLVRSSQPHLVHNVGRAQREVQNSRAWKERRMKNEWREKSYPRLTLSVLPLEHNIIRDK